MRGFIEFIRSKAVLGLAVGFILSSEISKVVGAIVNDIFNPLLGLISGKTGSLNDAYFAFGKAKFMWGNLLNVFLNFLFIALVVYFIVTKFGLDQKEKKA